jgi:hypothetical protein
MAEFHERLDAVHREVRDAGGEATAVLDARLAELGAAELPAGVSRLPSSCLRPGPHLAPQDDARDAELTAFGPEWAAAGRARSAAR